MSRKHSRGVRLCTQLGPLVLGLLLIPACQRPNGEMQRATAGPPPAVVAVAQLSADLLDFGDYFEANITGASRQLEENVKSRRQRREIVRWKIELTTQANDVLNEPNPAAALVDVWTLCARLFAAVRTDAAKELFGEQQPLAESTSRRLLSRIEQIARRHIPPETFDDVQQSVQRDAEQVPTTTTFSAPTSPRLSKRDNADPSLTDWLAMPLAPFQTFNNINRGVESVRELYPVAARFIEIVEDLPAQVRWQLELLLLELDELEAVKTLVVALDRFSQSSADMVEVVDTFPKKIRSESENLLQELDQRHGALDKSLQSAQDVANALQSSVAEAGDVAGQIDQTINSAATTADALTRTAEAVERVVTGIRELRDPDRDRPASDGKGFDVNDYGAAAQEITAAAQATQQVLAELRGMLQQDEVSPALDSARTQTAGVIDHSAQQLADVIDHATWRAVQVIGLIFALMVAYRLTVGRRRGRQASQASGPEA